MAKKKKRDFWDDVEVEEIEPISAGKTSRNQYPDNIDDDDDGGFRATRCMPLKIIMRILLFVLRLSAFQVLSVCAIWISGQRAARRIISAARYFRRSMIRRLPMC